MVALNVINTAGCIYQTYRRKAFENILNKKKKKKKMKTIDNETRSIVPIVIFRVIFVKILA